MAVIITESVISRFAEDLHQLRMIDYTATQGTGTSEEYQVEWSGKNVGESPGQSHITLHVSPNSRALILHVSPDSRA